MTNDQLEAEIKHLATKADLAGIKGDLANLKADILQVILEGERGQRNLIFGTYGLIIVGIFINHFWR
jgi:hypothetical protein